MARAHASLVIEHEALVDAYLKLESDHTRLQQGYDELFTSYASLDDSHRRLTIEHEALSESLMEMHEDYDIWMARSMAQSELAVTPPYILVEERRVHLAFRKLDGSVVRWYVPFESLEADIQRGYDMRNGWLSGFRPLLHLQDAAGNVFAPQDFRPFIDPRPFRGVMEQLYAESADDDAFVREVWHIIGQLSSYSYEIEETPRYPLETLLAGGGDCEDTGILLASMIRAAREDWPISLVYMDAYNPERPETVNHLIVHVDTGSRQYLIETTSNVVMEPFANVEGWYLAVD
jgi:transglutaminase-like putative cysteine protease